MRSILAVWNKDGAPVSQKTLSAMAGAGEHPRILTAANVAIAITGCRPGKRGDDGLLKAGPYLLVADARLDNEDELARALDVADPTTETLLLAAYRKWGQDCPNHLTGDFALIIWDGLSLFAATDVPGVRQLHYHNDAHQACLATYARQLKAHPRINPEISHEALLMWMLNVYDQHYSMYTNIHGLPSGTSLTITRKACHTRKWWPPPRIDAIQNETDIHEQFLHLLTRCVRDRCRSERPTMGSMLSGGLDSSSVTVLASRVMEKRVLPVSYRFTGLATCDESAPAREVAAMHGLDIRWIDAEENWLFKGLLATPQGENPFYCWDTLIQSLLASLPDTCDTLLTGHGGDLMLQGLTRKRYLSRAVRAGQWRLLPQLMTRLGKRPFSSVYRELIRPAFPETTGLLRRVMRRMPYRPPWIPARTYRAYNASRFFAMEPVISDDPVRQAVYEQIGPGAAGIRRAIHLMERLAAPMGITVCHPFFDRRIAEFVLALPHEHLIGGSLPKSILRHTMKDLLPDTVLQGTKTHPMASFYHYGITKEINVIRGMFEKSMLAQLGLLDTKPLLAAIEHYMASDPSRTLAPFLTIIQTEAWLRKADGEKRRKG